MQSEIGTFLHSKDYIVAGKDANGNNLFLKQVGKIKLFCKKSTTGEGYIVMVANMRNRNINSVIYQLRFIFNPKFHTDFDRAEDKLLQMAIVFFESEK